MIKIKICLFLFLTIIVAARIFSDSPPSANDVANTISNYWTASSFDELATYTTNLYHSYSNYVPAKLAHSFYAYVYRGEIDNAIQDLEDIVSSVASGGGYDETFSNEVYQLKVFLEQDRDMFLRHGSLDMVVSNASPTATKAAWGDELPPSLFIIFQAPEITITNAP